MRFPTWSGCWNAKDPSSSLFCKPPTSLRRRSVGNQATYVVNRNINFTNVCAKKCSFCAFSRTYRSDEGLLAARV